MTPSLALKAGALTPLGEEHYCDSRLERPYGPLSCVELLTQVLKQAEQLEAQETLTNCHKL